MDIKKKMTKPEQQNRAIVGDCLSLTNISQIVAPQNFFWGKGTSLKIWLRSSSICSAIIFWRLSGSGSYVSKNEKNKKCEIFAAALSFTTPTNVKLSLIKPYSKTIWLAGYPGPMVSLSVGNSPFRPVKVRRMVISWFFVVPLYVAHYI